MICVLFNSLMSKFKFGCFSKVTINWKIKWE